MRKAIFTSAAYQAIFKSIKDYNQLIIVAASLSYIIFTSLSVDQHSKIYIGGMYAAIYLMSSVASKYAYKVKAVGSTRKIISFIWLLSAVLMFILNTALNSIFIILGVFLSLYMMMNIRRPVMVEIIGDVSKPDKRATVLSVESQITSLLIAIFAPLIGLLADYSMKSLFMVFGFVMSVIFIGTLFKQKQCGDTHNFLNNI